MHAVNIQSHQEDADYDLVKLCHIFVIKFFSVGRTALKPYFYLHTVYKILAYHHNRLKDINVSLKFLKDSNK